MSDTQIYKAGETVTATLTLEAGHTTPTRVWVTLNLQAGPGTAVPAPFPDRVAFLSLQTSMSGAAAPASGAATTLQLQAVVPKHIVGGVYKPTSALFFMPDGSQRQVPEPDPDGDFVRYIADDPPTAFDTPVIMDLD